MSEKDKSYIDPELEKFLKENKEMIRRLFREEKEIVHKLFKEEKECFKSTFDEEWTRAEDLMEEQKKKAKEAAQGVFNAVTDPEVQRHFMAMGMEFMMGMNALMKSMPFPEGFKDMAKKAEEARKGAAKSASKSEKPKSSGSEKIEIKSVPKKRAPAAKPKAPASSKKTSDKNEA